MAKTIEFIGRTLTQQEAQGLLDWLIDPRGSLYWQAMTEEREISEKKALSLNIDTSIHPQYDRDIRSQHAGRADAYSSMFECVEHIKEVISNTHEQDK